MVKQGLWLELLWHAFAKDGGAAVLTLFQKYMARKAGLQKNTKEANMLELAPP